MVMRRLLATFAVLLAPLCCLAQFSWPTYPVTAPTQIYTVMKDNGSGVAVPATNDGTIFLGINQNSVVTSKGSVQIQTSGPSQVLVGTGPLAMGALVTSDASGNVKAFAPTAGGATHCYLGTVIGLGTGAGATGTYIYVNINPVCSASSSAGGGVTSFNARTGVVVPVLADYQGLLWTGPATLTAPFNVTDSLGATIADDNVNGFQIFDTAGGNFDISPTGGVKIEDAVGNSLVMGGSNTVVLNNATGDSCTLSPSTFSCTVPSGSVQSVFGRTGAVTALLADYQGLLWTGPSTLTAPIHVTDSIGFGFFDSGALNTGFNMQDNLSPADFWQVAQNQITGQSAFRRLIELVRKRAHGHRNGDVLRSEEGELALPIETGGDGRVRQPVEGDVVEDVVPRQSLRLCRRRRAR